MTAHGKKSTKHHIAATALRSHKSGAPHVSAKPHKKKTSLGKNTLYALGLSAWVIASFIIGNLLTIGLLYALKYGIFPAINTINDTVLETVTAALVYVFSFIVAAGVPYMVWKRKTTIADVGLTQSLPAWRDIGLAVPIYVVCLFTSGIVINILAQLIPALNPAQPQSVGFQNMTHQYEMALAYVTLAVVAPFCEELLFRGYLFGKLRKTINAGWTIFIVAFVFAILHIPGFDSHNQLQLQWNVAIDVFILAIALGILREKTGSIWAGVLVHMVKNSVAFYFLFVMPIISILGGH